MIPLEKRSSKSKGVKKHTRIKAAKKFTTGLAASSLLISGLSQLTGHTYGAFNDKEMVRGQIKMCEIFPSSIESKFEQLIQIIVQYNELTESMPDHKKLSVTEPSITISDGPTLEELAQLKNEISSKKEGYQEDLNDTKKKKEDYETHTQALIEQLKEVNEIITFLLKYKHYDSNCITIDKSTIHTSLNEALSEAEFLSPLIRNSVKGLLHLYPTKENRDLSVPTTSISSEIDIDKEVSNEFGGILEDLTQHQRDLEEAMKHLAKKEKDIKIKEDELEEKAEAEAAKKEAEEKEEAAKEEQSPTDSSSEDSSAKEDAKNEDDAKDEQPSSDKDSKDKGSPEKEEAKEKNDTKEAQTSSNKDSKDSPTKEDAKDKQSPSDSDSEEPPKKDVKDEEDKKEDKENKEKHPSGNSVNDDSKPPEDEPEKKKPAKDKKDKEPNNEKIDSEPEPKPEKKKSDDNSKDKTGASDSNSDASKSNSTDE